MNKHISISIKTLREQIVSAINVSELPASIVEPVLNAIYQQIVMAAQNEVLQAEREAKAEEEQEVTNA